MATHKFYYFHIQSDDEAIPISPSSLCAKDLARLILLLDEAVAIELKEHHGKEMETQLHIEKIEKGSIMLAVSGDKLTRKAFLSYGNAISSGCLSNKQLRHMEKIYDYNASHNIKICLKTSKSAEAFSIIENKNKNKTSHIEKFSIDVLNNFYGKVINIHGSNKIKVVISPIGYSGYIEFSVKKDDAKKLGAKFNDIIEVTGEARVSLPERKIESFKLNKINFEYRDGNLTEKIKKLRNDFGIFFKDIQDPVDFVRNLRG